MHKVRDMNRGDAGLSRVRVAILPAHEAQLHTYLNISRPHVGLILNFNARRLADGIRRYVV
jgi:GxxExxY protein